MVELINLNKTYISKNRKKVYALRNISLRLPESGLIFITGKSGSGKSTLLNLIGGLDDITNGDIIINDNNLSKFKLDDFANYRSTYVGFIFQNYHILDEFTVKENIELSADISNVDCDIKRNLEFVDLEGYEERYPTELSGGQQQRVAIARALAKDSKIILADEPTGNLDVKTSKQILKILKEVSKTRLVLIVSHNLDDAATYADRIISLDNGSIVSDVSRITGYSNKFRIEDNTLYLPNNKDLKDEELVRIINEKDQYNNIVQLDGGMLPTDLKEENIKNEKMHKSKLSRDKFKKLFKLIFKRRIFNKVLTILLISVLLSLFSIFQSFNAFDENEKIMDNLIETEENILVAKKNSFKGVSVSNMVAKVNDEDYEAFKKCGYEGNIYKLYNHCIPILSTNIMLLTYKPITSIINGFYASETYGTLKCDQDFLTRLYGIDGNLDVLAGDLEGEEHGVIITDYVADSILFYNNTVNGREKIYTYEDILGTFPKANYSSGRSNYINAIINTNYKERYKDLIKIFSYLWDDDPSNDDISNEIKSDKTYSNFSNEVQKYLGISYTFSDKYEESLYSTKQMVAATIYKMTLESGEISHEFGSFSYYIDSLIKKELTGNDVYMTTKAYDAMFGTNYTKDGLSEFVPHEITVLKKYLTEEYYRKTLNVVGLVVSNNIGVYTSEEVYNEYMTYKLIPYALYFDSINHKKDLSNVIEDYGYKLLTDETSAIAMVNRVIDIFGTFLNIISMCLLLVCVVYLIHFGYKSIKSNMYEIGIITALGCDNNNMGKLFVFEILSVGVGIIVASFIGMYIAAGASNAVLIASFEQVFGYTLNSLDVISFSLNNAVIDLMLAVVLIVFSALFPLLMIRKIKPVNILKAKE